MAGLLYLQHTFTCSDEAPIWTWVENPYRQHFCGETYFQHEPPIDPSPLSPWRKRIDEAGVEWLLMVTIEAAQRAQVIKAASVEKVIATRRSWRRPSPIKRRSAIEPMIGHMKNEGLLRRNWLRGSLGDALHAVLCGAGHNLRMILRKLQLLRAQILALLEALSAFPAAAKNQPAPVGFAA